MLRAKKRGSLDRIENEKLTFFNQVREAYLQRARQYSARIKMIDATQSLENVQKDIRQGLVNLISVQDKKSPSLAKLFENNKMH